MPTIAKHVAAKLSAASFIREMFERGRRLRAERGPENVFDFSLGNPNAAPPPEFFAALQQTAAEHDPAAHRYMPNAGLPAARDAVAAMLTQTYGLAFDGAGVVLTSGAAGATNVVLAALLDPADEVIVLAPYFPEYRFYIEQAGGRMVVAQTDDVFQIDADAIRAAMTSRTRAVLINTPNNPTGAVYPTESLASLGALLAEQSDSERPIYLVCDDVYHRIAYDVEAGPAPAAHYAHSVVVSSYSKDLSIAGERVGYVALPNATPHRDELLSAFTMLNRTLGFVNANAFMQRVVTHCASACCDLTLYRGNRDLLCDALADFGYELARPAGALYAFPKTPIADDDAFVAQLAERGVLAVPGRGFGRAGHMRLSFCVERDMIERALPHFAAARSAVG